MTYPWLHLITQQYSILVLNFEPVLLGNMVYPDPLPSEQEQPLPFVVR